MKIIRISAETREIAKDTRKGIPDLSNLEQPENNNPHAVDVKTDLFVHGQSRLLHKFRSRVKLKKGLAQHG